MHIKGAFFIFMKWNKVGSVLLIPAFFYAV